MPKNKKQKTNMEINEPSFDLHDMLSEDCKQFLLVGIHDEVLRVL